MEFLGILTKILLPFLENFVKHGKYNLENSPTGLNTPQMDLWGCVVTFWHIPPCHTLSGFGQPPSPLEASQMLFERPLMVLFHSIIFQDRLRYLADSWARVELPTCRQIQFIACSDMAVWMIDSNDHVYYSPTGKFMKSCRKISEKSIFLNLSQIFYKI